MYIQQFDNLIHLVLPVKYASLCHAVFSRIQSVVYVFIVLSQLVICLNPTVQCIFNSLTILLLKAYSSMYIQQFDNLTILLLKAYSSTMYIQQFDNLIV